MALKSDVRTGSIERELSNTTVSLSLAFLWGGAGGLSPVWNGQNNKLLEAQRKHITRDNKTGIVHTVRIYVLMRPLTVFSDLHSNYVTQNCCEFLVKCRLLILAYRHSTH